MTWLNDEGFSEETRMAEDALDNEVGPSASQIPDWVARLPARQKSELAYAILRSLPTSNIALIVDKLNPLLHIDPILHLPAEITQEIFAYLDLPSLVTATVLSRSWRLQALDPQLWKHLFASEGWKADYKRVWDFEEGQRQRDQEKQRERKSRARPADAVSDTECKSPKKRAREQSQFQRDDEDSAMLEVNAASPARWAEQHGTVEADDVDMEDLVPGSTRLDDEDQAQQAQLSLFNSRRNTTRPQPIYPPIKSTLLTTEFSSSAQINWQYLYKQKRRLEENWKAARFTNFTLPHPSHPHEAHAECIYTIQYVGKHLVSGSRDRTIRIWDLDTQRLILPPLRGHEASVLCLQFDMRPSEDVIISGGSDCHIIVWQFSTGKMLKKIERAHHESVLNLRFDSQYLITCSKDRTIKVWNRHSLLPDDEAYPAKGSSSSARWPSYIIDISDEMARTGLRIQPLAEYSLLMTLNGHSAAVNAIQVLDNTIVSASGDRHIKVWNIKTGMCTKTIYGHQKGIACVQFDGRRIVSGSSDETVRIFDAVTAAEVACLRGHAELVRTVQARFGDVMSDVKKEEAEARALDQKFFKASASNPEQAKLSREQWRARNAGSSDVNDVFAYGAKLPPGGGGSKWARIVSGSYDETIIIWTRNPKGKWIPLHQLTQWEAILRAGGQPRYIPQPGQFPPAQHIANGEVRRRAQRTHHNNHRQQPQQQQQPQAAQGRNGRTQQRTAHLTQNHASNAQSAASPSSMQAQHSTSVTPDPPTASASSAAAVMLRNDNAASRPQPSPPQATAQPIPHRPVQPGQQAQAGATTTQAPTAPASNSRHTQAQAALATQSANAQAQATAGAQAGPHHGQRIYKLQFCSRRLLCCSVEPIIVGWDFCCGDRDLEIASEFFSEES
ncbi:WD40 repeat-like protein [Microthyrium microscopicum]|uniref:WD40 repeat-like protein n=1 Tax=Microthyrium microscopicum TaxID=703497 RepID=A0A6A6US42_9PEZI|nr:WD40 repeat-like protein [Microthyrium microscopicum]